MDSQRAVKLLDETFNQEFDIERFAIFISELFNHFNFKRNFKDDSVPLSTEYNDYIEKLQSLGVYRDSNNETLEVFAVKLKRDSSVEKARTMQRNSIATYLKKFNRNASLVAFYGDDEEDWRFSFVKVDYELFKDEKGDLKVDEKLTPAKRYSFLVGKNEPNHTCRSQFFPLIEKEIADPTLEEIENVFSVEKVTKEFFNKYKGLYLDLKESLEQTIKDDPIIKTEFDEKNIDTADFAKKLMGQIVFIYFLQKKGWLGVEMDQEWGTGPKNFLRTLYDKKNYENFFNDVLEPLFYDALATDRYDDYYEKFECRIPFLNGGLFEPINLYNWRKTDIKINNKIFEDILDTFDLFNFTIKEDEPLERIVAVDPEMLGKVFENLLEVKDRKSKGAFYTPREIVHYMCQQSLINYLNTNLDIPKEDIENFIQLGDFALDSIIRAKELGQSSKRYALPESIKTHYEVIDKLIIDIKVVDPAVGSGAFLLGMMNEILKVKSILSLLKDENNINYDIKREIIENSLYGVDLDSSAVDVTKLRFWLSLVVDEEQIDDIRPLPNLDHKIMCGNSLLEEYNGMKLFDEKILIEDVPNKKELVQSTLFDERLNKSRKKLKDLKKIQKLYFNEQNKKQKDNYRAEIDKLEWELIEETLKEEGYEESIQKLEYYKKSNSKPFFLWKLYFAEVFQSENPGFDVIIANPPYISAVIHSKNNSDERDQYRDVYPELYGAFDLYSVFLLKGLDLINSKGSYAWIIPNKFLVADYAKKILEKMKNKGLYATIDVSKYNVFHDVGIYPIILLGNMQSNMYNNYSINELKDLETNNIIIHKDLFEFKTFKEFGIVIGSGTTGFEAKKIKPLITDYNERSSSSIPFAVSGSIDPYVINTKKVRYMKSFYEYPYITHDPSIISKNKWNFWSNEKIVVAGMTKKIEAHYVKEPLALGVGCYAIYDYGKFNPKFLLALLNSKFLSVFLNIKFKDKHLAGGYLAINKSTIEQLPLVDANLEEQIPFVELVDRIMSITKEKDYLNNSKKQSNIKELEREIDKLVYALYELTLEEIKIVEEFSN